MTSPAVPFAFGGPDAIAPPAPPARRLGPTLALVGVGVLALVLSVPLYRHGIAGHGFPTYLEDGPGYEVQRYTAPWIAGGLASAGLGVILLVVAAGRLIGRRRMPTVTVTAPTMSTLPVVVPAAAVDSDGLRPLPSEAAREY